MGGDGGGGAGCRTGLRGMDAETCPTPGWPLPKAVPDPSLGTPAEVLDGWGTGGKVCTVAGYARLPGLRPEAHRQPCLLSGLRPGSAGRTSTAIELL